MTLRRSLPLLASLALAAIVAPVTVARSAGLRDGYPSSSDVEGRIRRLAGDIPGASFLEYGKSLQGRPLLVLRITRGPGDPEQKPAFLVVAGLEPSRLAAAEMALSVAEIAGARPASGSDRLENAVLYVIADANPDGRTRVLGGASDDRNAHPIDDDADGRVDEDGPDDLDGDRLIRTLRVYRPGGEWRPDSADARANSRADASKGEAGLFVLVPEGSDNDRDGQVGEDPEGGVNLNLNLPHGYRMFHPGAGTHAVSEPETKALVDFVVAHPHIAGALVFASDDVLTEAPKPALTKEPGGAPASGTMEDGTADAEDKVFRALRSDRTPTTGILKADIAPYERAATRYVADTGVKKDSRSGDTPGSFGDWLRYQRGIFALVTPGWTWSGSDSAASPDSANAPKSGGGPKKSKRSDEAVAIEALEKAGVSEFTPWVTTPHPDFPGREVQLGGLDPLVFRAPPHGDVARLGERHGTFVTELLGWLPELRLAEPVVEKLSAGVYRVRTEVVNEGYLPTASHQGVKSRKSRPVRIDIETPSGARLLAGLPVTLIPSLSGGGGHRDLEWIVQAEPGSRMAIQAATPRAGLMRREVRFP